MKRPATNPIHLAVDKIDHVVPAGRQVVIRTFPDFDDQSREVGAALAARGIPITLLVDDLRSPSPPLDFPCRIVRSTSIAAAWAFWRAAVVVHTHGVYGSIAGSRGKRFVNLWHGMPVKRLPDDTDLGHNQTDVTFATSRLHAANLAATWQLDEEQVHVVGLPRNDALVRSQEPGRTGTEVEAPLALWLPTFRSRPHRPDELDGTDIGTVTQFEGADLDRVDELAGRSGFHILIKPHPAAAPPRAMHLDHVTVWGNEELRSNGWTLYRLLARADLLITDVSSVWIDYLALDRPILFAMSDRDEYLAGRGSYFDDLDDLVPGTICEDFEQLDAALMAHKGGADPWAEERRRARRMHHSVEPGSAAAHVADIVVRFLDHPPRRAQRSK
ncbi:MAG: CDP-glycerol glycerophosphotransferase family protein [Acidimicrobiales bacterium]|nr:CDP-glycerol glycerophosphotransferase family protein [Acidimicrobiales bacterium]